VTRLEPHLYFGLDLGRRQDPAALAVVERLHEPTGARNPATWEPVLELVLVVRHVEVFQLGTPYTRLVGRVARLLREPRTLEGYELRAGHLLRPHQTLVMDATGVGDPVVELFQAERLPARLHPVSITSGGRARDLLSNLRIQMERPLLVVPRDVHGQAELLDELLRATEPAASAHDDRVMALALAVWQATRGLAGWLAE
jgi:hypothetical protein